jgi:hypothetical protein
VIVVDSVHLTSDHSPLSKRAFWRDSARTEPGDPLLSPPAFENLSAAGCSSVQVGGIQVPLWSLPPNPQRVLVPQRRIETYSKRDFHPEPPILFAVGDQSGMSLEDAMNERYEGLVGRDDGMFVGRDCTAISLRIEVYPVPLFFEIACARKVF